MQLLNRIYKISIHIQSLTEKKEQLIYYYYPKTEVKKFRQIKNEFSTK